MSANFRVSHLKLETIEALMIVTIKLMNYLLKFSLTFIYFIERLKRNVKSYVSSTL